ncbi:MAG TPA: hypothetical protein VFX00_11015 [Pedococcus sp.]|nr:hypothetical protein [Nocardioidaceae bacterium]HEX5428846.1 hypothetical protein [Pedococcus sp.]
MTQTNLNGTPDLMPVLSRGKHRNPRKGACFMELASYLAGEKWSDHPACTHRLLAALARDVNDHVGDAARRELAPMIPEVIGLRSDDPRVDAWIAREVALTALPISSAERQGVAAVGLLRCERVLAGLEGHDRRYVSPRTARALDAVPVARDWARGFVAIGWGGPGSFARRSAPAIVHSAVSGIACSVIDDVDGILVDLLGRTIEQCKGWFGREGAEVSAGSWREVTDLTHR